MISFYSQLKLIALNKPLTGKMNGVNTIDLYCHQQARRASLKATFRGFLSNQIQDLKTLIYDNKERNYPIVNSKVKLQTFSSS